MIGIGSDTTSTTNMYNKYRFHVQDAGTGDRGQTGMGQISHFKQHAHVGFQRNSFIGGQGQCFVHVHHTVHGFDPNRVLEREEKKSRSVDGRWKRVKQFQPVVVYRRQKTKYCRWKRVTKSKKEWQRVKKNDKEWKKSEKESILTKSPSNAIHLGSSFGINPRLLKMSDNIPSRHSRVAEVMYPYNSFGLNALGFKYSILVFRPWTPCAPAKPRMTSVPENQSNQLYWKKC